MTACIFLRDLNIERSKDAEVLNKYSGIRQLLTDLYPDNAHFIYELLQNAEDAQATEITFNLKPDTLIVEHNAKRTFSENDIKAITGIGASSKRDDINAIGKFGVGFKSVYGYTDTPRIHSGGYSFKIYDLIIPEEIDPIENRSNITVFEFPFNNPRKPKEKAFEEIAYGLRDLSGTTLLFLTHIKSVNWQMNNEPLCYTRLQEHADHRIEIKTCLGEEETYDAYYLRFMSQIPDKPSHLQVGLAYSIQYDKDTCRFDKNTQGLVSIFFPAEKETSNFRFHIHAPFSATVARDSIKDIAENFELIEAIAELAATSLHTIKSLNLLNRSFLDVLPNSNDNIQEFYAPVAERIWAELRSQPLIPSFSGDYYAGDNLYHASNDKNEKLKKLLDGSDLSYLENRAGEILGWCLDIPESLRAKTGISPISSEHFINRLVHPNFSLTQWLESKENDWMQRLYSYLEANEKNNYKLRQTSLVRLDDGTHVSGTEAYFPIEGSSDDKEFPGVCSATYSTGAEERHEEQKQARGFLHRIGVREITDETRIESILNAWSTAKPSDSEYIKSLNYFMEYSKKGRYWHLKNKRIFWGDAQEDEIIWCSGDQIFIDSPFLETGIADWFSTESNFYPLSKKYLKFSSLLTIDDLIDFVKKLGAKETTELTNDDIDKVSRKWGSSKESPPGVEEHIKYMRGFVAYWKKSYYRLDFFAEKAIFWGEKNGETKLVKASELFLDTPWGHTGLSAWYADERNRYIQMFLLSPKYQPAEIKGLIDFVKAFGAIDRLPIIKYPGSEQRNLIEHYKKHPIKETKDKYDIDWCISNKYYHYDEFKDWLKKPSIEKAFAIWHTMCHSDTKEEVLTARYKRLQKPADEELRGDSRLVFSLSESCWVPQIDGEDEAAVTFVTPAEASKSRLPKDFKYNDSNGWLHAIHFGKKEEDQVNELRRQQEQQNASYQEKRTLAKEEGFDSVEEMQEASALMHELKKMGVLPKELLDGIKSRSELPEETVPNPERRRKGIQERGENAPSKESVQRERSIQPGISKLLAEAKAYLRAKYTNPNHELICQCCQKEMPFKLNDQDYYFESVQCIKSIDKLYPENRIALCPVCAAMYQHARTTDDNEIRTLIILRKISDNEGSVEIPLLLAGQQKKLRFVGTHFFDLKTILESESIRTNE